MGRLEVRSQSKEEKMFVAKALNGRVWSLH